MLAPRWHKVLRDLLHARSRTLLVVLSIAVGVFAFGTIRIALTVTVEQLRATYSAINPVSAILTTAPFDDDLVAAVARLPGVAATQGRRVVTARLRLGPNRWENLQLYVLPDDGVTKINKVKPEAGAWPLPDRSLLIERSSMAKVHAAIGTSVYVELPGQTGRELLLAGTTHDLSLPPAVIAGQAFGYVNEETLAWLGGPAQFNQMLLVVAEKRSDAAHIRVVAEAAERLIERGGREVTVIDVPVPLQHPAETILPTMILIMSVLSLMALLISGFLIINTISAILTQQTRQIGIMKAIGARSDQLMGLYFVMVAGFGLLALAVALPLGALGAYAFSIFIASQLNVDLSGFRVPLEVFVLEAVAALVVPIATAALPIRTVLRRPAREALSYTGIAPSAKPSPLDRLISHLPTLSQPTRLSLRNTFRRKGRLVRTLVALALGGAVFISVMSLYQGLVETMDESIASQRYDIEVLFSRPYRDTRAAQAALAVPGVTGVESLLRNTIFPVRADGSTGEGITLRALPPTTTLFTPRLESGRWLTRNDERAIVISTNYLTKEPHRLGDRLTIQIDGQNYDWTLIGFIQEFLPPSSPAIAYVNLAAYTHIAGGVGRTDTLRLSTIGHDAASHAASVAALESQLSSAGFTLRQIRSRSQDRALLYERFNLLTSILTIMAALIATVGGLGLTGTMSINVLERTREIGVMRAIGASDGAIRQVVIGEGLAIGLMAWTSGALLAVPMSYILSYQFGISLLNIPLEWRYSFPAVGGWLLIVLCIATLASLLPARSATRLTVREVLAYE